jgi:[ribosomal protein S18]-alanine N-acetyltransferase
MPKTSSSVKGVRFEPLSEAHIASIMEIEKVSNGSPWSERSFRNELEHPNGVFLVAMDGGRVIGYAGAWFVVDEAHITTVAIDPNYRRRGIGRALTIAILGEAKERSMACSTLEVRAGNEAAIELYQQLGYVTTAKRRAYYPDNQEDALVMWLHDLQTWSSTP